jgi:hypothetical protein
MNDKYKTVFDAIEDINHIVGAMRIRVKELEDIHSREVLEKHVTRRPYEHLGRVKVAKSNVKLVLDILHLELDQTDYETYISVIKAQHHKISNDESVLSFAFPSPKKYRYSLANGYLYLNRDEIVCAKKLKEEALPSFKKFIKGK